MTGRERRELGERESPGDNAGSEGRGAPSARPPRCSATWLAVKLGRDDTAELVSPTMTPSASASKMTARDACSTKSGGGERGKGGVGE